MSESIFTLGETGLYIIPAGKEIIQYRCPYHGIFLSVEDANNPPEMVTCPHVKGDFEYPDHVMDISNYEHCEMNSPFVKMGSAIDE